MAQFLYTKSFTLPEPKSGKELVEQMQDLAAQTNNTFRKEPFQSNNLVGMSSTCIEDNLIIRPRRGMFLVDENDYGSVEFSYYSWGTARGTIYEPRVKNRFKELIECFR
jgi:hypothetical protein